MMKEFLRDDAWQLPLAIKFLTPCYQRRGWEVLRYPGNHPMQRCHVDVQLSKNERIMQIDEKIIRGRRDGYPATKVSLETWSCSVRGKERPGWLHPDEHNEATHLLICNSDISDLKPDSWKKVTSLDCRWMPLAPLRSWFWGIGEQRWEVQDNQQQNHSLSRKVPIREILSALPEARRFWLFAKS